MTSSEEFRKIFGKDPDTTAFCPYRIAPIGALTDHQLGVINGMAINKGIHFSYGINENGICDLYSTKFDENAQFHVNHIPKHKQFDWADYLRGAAMILGEHYDIHYGVFGVFHGDIPIGGLSSSAAITLVFLKALTDVNDICISEADYIRIAKQAENEYVGVKCGVLDQYCEVWSKKDHLLFYDIRRDAKELIKTPESMPKFKIAVIFSGVERSLTNSKYNVAQDESKAAAFMMKTLSGNYNVGFEDSFLGNILETTYERYSYQLPERWRDKATYFYNDRARAEFGKKLWSEGKLEDYGRLMFDSADDVIRYYGNGSAELITLHDISKTVDGIYGGCLSGAGIKGNYVALIDPNKAEAIENEAKKRYLSEFPEFSDKFKIFLCDPADGIEIQKGNNSK